MRNISRIWTFRLLGFIILISLSVTQTSCKRKIEVKSLERQKIYEECIDSIIIDREAFNEVDRKKILIKDEKQFIRIVEPILFDIYGKDNCV
jgi:hypothetical protein